MGNETARQNKNKNSFSLDFGHELNNKILPNKNQFKLDPISSNSQLSVLAKTNKFRSQSHKQSEKSNQDNVESSSNRLSFLNKKNDELRNDLIKISSELTMRLKKKKFTVKKGELLLGKEEQKKLVSLKGELDNAYKQIDLYKKTIQELKNNNTSERADMKLVAAQNKVSEVDLQLEKVNKQIQSLKNVVSTQNQGMKRDRGWNTVDELKSQIEMLKIRVKDINKLTRKNEKKHMEQHQYMLVLDQKIRELNGEYFPDPKNLKAGTNSQQEEQIKVSQEQIAQAQKQVKYLKIRHEEYHKKINFLLLFNKQIKEEKKEAKQVLEEKKKDIEGLKYKRDALVKQIKDNLYLFATRHEYKDEEEELSEFVSDDEQEITPIQEEMDEKGTFDIDHLKDHTLKSKSKQSKEVTLHQQQESRVRSVEEDPKIIPKLWKQRLTRLVDKGKVQQRENKFQVGISKVAKKDIKIVMMNVWMTKKKQITAIQPVYLIDGEVIDGSKSSNNVEDEYKVSYELEEHDYLKSVIGIFGRTGFLQYLVLQSNDGKISKIGRSQTDGDNFAIGVAKEETPIQITGANSLDGDYWRINRLCFEVLIQSI